MQNKSSFKQFLGIDISKSKLDIYNSQTCDNLQIKHTLGDIYAFIETIKPADNLLVVIDLTGGYEQKCESSAQLIVQAFMENLQGKFDHKSRIASSKFIGAHFLR